MGGVMDGSHFPKVQSVGRNGAATPKAAGRDADQLESDRHPKPVGGESACASQGNGGAVGVMSDVDQFANGQEGEAS